MKKLVQKIKDTLSILNSGKGFTLIELLVVVLIIGILATIALPQYKKVIWRSRAKSMLSTLRSIKTSIDAYYLVNDKYPSKLNELDITLDGYTKGCNYFGPLFVSGGCKANSSVNLFLNVASAGRDANPMFQFNNGPYLSAGFFIFNDKIYCYENKVYIHEPKSFCEKVMGCEYTPGLSGYSSDLIFTCPEL